MSEGLLDVQASVAFEEGGLMRKASEGRGMRKFESQKQGCRGLMYCEANGTYKGCLLRGLANCS